MQHGLPVNRPAHLAIILIGFCVVALDGFGQQILWRTNYHGNGSGTAIGDRVSGMTLDPAGNVYVTGQSGTTNRNHGVATLKHGAMGRLEWEARYSSTTNIGYVDTPVQVLVDPATNVFVLGYSWKEGELLDTFVLKYSPDGVLLRELHRGAPYGYPSGIGHMLWSQTGHLLVTGTAPGTNGLPVIRTTQYDADGQEIWTAQSQGVNPVHFAERLRIDAVGTISVMAQSSNNLIRLFYDGSGNLMSNIVFGLRPTSDFSMRGRLPTAEGGLAVAGLHSCGGFAIGRYRPDGSESVMSAYKARPSGYGIGLNAYALDEQENLYVAGNNCNYGFCEESYNFDLIVLKYDRQGKRVWGNSFRNEFELSYFVSPVVIKFDSGGNVYVGTMAYIVKYDSNGNRLWHVSTTGCEFYCGQRMANLEIGPEGDIFMAGTQSRVGSSEDFLVARWRQPVTTNLAVLTSPLPSQVLASNSAVNLGPIVIQPEPLPFGTNWLRWGNFVSSRWLTFTNPTAGEYSLQIFSPGGTTYSGWTRVSYLPQLANLALLPEGQISFSIIGETHVYTIEGSTDLVHWQPVTNIFYCGTSPITNVVAPVGSRFFRASRSD